MMTTAGLQSVLGQSYYAGAPNAGTYATPSIVSGDPTPAATDAFSGSGTILGLGTGRLSLTLLGLIVVGLVAFNYWVHPISA